MCQPTLSCIYSKGKSYSVAKKYWVDFRYCHKYFRKSIYRIDSHIFRPWTIGPIALGPPRNNRLWSQFITQQSLWNSWSCKEKEQHWNPQALPGMCLWPKTHHEAPYCRRFHLQIMLGWGSNLSYTGLLKNIIWRCAAFFILYLFNPGKVWFFNC